MNFFKLSDLSKKYFSSPKFLFISLFASINSSIKNFWISLFSSDKCSSNNNSKEKFIIDFGLIFFSVLNLFINIITVRQNLAIELIVKYFLEFSSNSLSLIEFSKVDSSPICSFGFLNFFKIIIFSYI